MALGKAEIPVASSVAAILLFGYLFPGIGLAVAQLPRTLAFSICVTLVPVVVPEHHLFHGHNPEAPGSEDALLQEGCFIVPPHPSGTRN